MEAPRRATEDQERSSGALVAAAPPAKRAKTDIVISSSGASNGKQLGISKGGIRRTSSLEAPTMLLSGHEDEVFSVKFNPAGTVIASGSNDKHIYLWNVHGECENYMAISGHKNAVLELHWTTDGTRLVTASPDQTVRAWDAETGQQVKKMKDHDSFVNACCPARRGDPLVVSGADDGTAKLWDLRARGCQQTFPDKYQVTAVAFGDDGSRVFTGGLDNDVKAWDIRNGEVVMTLKGHTDTITGLSVSPDGNHVLSNAMDHTMRMWDVRPFAPDERCEQMFRGHQHTFEKKLLRCGWSPEGDRVTGGSGNGIVHIWKVEGGELLYRLPGHKGSVNEVQFHPKETVIVSGSSDKQIYLGEL